MFRKVLVFAIAAMVLASMASAQDLALKDKNEVSFAAAWIDVEDVSATLVAAHYGRFITPNLEAQIALIWAKADAGGPDVSALAVAPAVAWHFISPNTTNIVPYLGVGWYFIDVDFGGSESTSGLEAFAGVKFFVGGDYKCSNRAIFVEYRYFNDINFGGGGANVNTVMLGITNFF